MSCTTTCNTTNLFESTREARLEAIAKAARDEDARREQVSRLNQIRQSIAVRDAKEQARYQALQDAEKAFKIRERDILEKQLEETLHSMKRMQDQYQEFVTTTQAIAEKLNNPASLFKTSTIVSVDELKDYFNLTYKDGREVRLPFGAIDMILKSKLQAINAEFCEHNEMILQVQTDLADQAEQITSMANLFQNLVKNVATYESDQKVELAEFKKDVHGEIQNIKCDVTTIAESFRSLTRLVENLNATVNALVAG